MWTQGSTLQDKCPFHCSVPLAHMGTWAPSLRKQSLAAGDLSLSGTQWAGRKQIPGTEGLCLPAVGQAGLGCAAKPRSQPGANSLDSC